MYFIIYEFTFVHKTNNNIINQQMSLTSVFQAMVRNQ